MRLALIGPVYPYRGGIAHYTTMLYRTLMDMGHEVLLVSFKRQYPQWLFPGQSDRDPTTIQPLALPDAHYWMDSLNPFSWVGTFKRLRRYQPDGIVLQWWTPFWALPWIVLGVLNRLLGRRPLIFICHNVLPHEAKAWDVQIAKAVLRWGDGFTVQSAAEKQKLSGWFPQARITATPLPVYAMFANAPLSKAVARERLGLTSDALVLLFFGIVREYKGLRDLLAALPAIQAQLPMVKLLIAGEFWDNKTAYQTLIHQLGIESLVRIDDRYIPDDEVMVYFSAADVLVVPYRSVTGSAVVQTARGFGLPVITTALNGLEAVLVEGETGFLVPPQDPSALALAIVRYFQEEQGKRMSQKMRQSVADFSWEKLSQEVLALVEGR